MDIVLRRTRGLDGYRLALVCDYCEHTVIQVNPASPVWTLVVEIDGHMTMAHQTDTSDDAVGRVAYSRPGKAVETLSLPEDDDRCLGCGEPKGVGSHGASEFGGCV